MEKLSTDKRSQVLRCLIEGSSIRSTERITGVAKSTILRYLAEAGEACSAFLDEKMQGLPCDTLQLDEVWSFVGCHEKNKEGAVNEHPGDVWTWTAICADTKIIPSFRVGDRSADTAFDFCRDLSGRFSGHLQITSDGLQSYRFGIGHNFPDADFAQLVKIYGRDDQGNEIVTGIKRQVIQGSPNPDKISTSYVERSNLTIRMTNRRFTRKTNAFSKKLEAHCHMLAVCLVSYNFCRKHQTLKTTPAVAAEIADHIYSMEEIVEIISKFQERKEEANFEAAFSNLKFTAPRKGPIQPAEKLLPWYLDPESGGPNPPAGERKPGIRYEGEFL